MEYLGQLWEGFLLYLNTQPPGWIYFFLFLGAFTENVFPPIPGDTLIVFGAYLAGLGVISVWPAYFAMFAGSAAGCLVVYGLAVWKGRDFFLHLERRFFDESKLETAEQWFQRHGMRIIVFNRFLPTVRAFVGIVAGISGIRPVPMAVYVLIGTFLWNSLLVYFGLMVGENWQLVITVLQAYNKVVLSAAVMALGGYYGWKWWRRSRGSGEGQAGEDDRKAV